ncbi:TPA: hypothetical protein ACWWCX_002695 [Enterococcus faecium]
MNDFNEAVLTLNVNVDVADVYKKAIEAENSPNGLRDHWNGNHAYVVIGDKEVIYQENKPIDKNTVELTIQLLSHTSKNLKETVKWYKQVGCNVIRTDYKE